MFLRKLRSGMTVVCSALMMLFVLPGALLAQGGNATVHGVIADPDAAIVPGATVMLTPVSGNALTVQSGSDGGYRISAPAGTYVLTVTMPGFATYNRTGMKLAAGASVTADVKLIVGEQTQVITVTSDAVSVGVDADTNASATVIKGKDLEALSDDPDELSSELSALAGPAAGPNGGQIYVDGFTGGQLPPKSSIREIRINQNPFSAQYDRLGFGRVEVFTKPGTDKLHGSLSTQGNDKALNTSNPFLGASNTQPDYHTVFLMGNVTGPLTKWSSFSAGGSRRSIQNNVIVDPTGFYAASPTATTPCDPGASGCANYVYPSGARAVFQPQLRSDFSPRLDFALGQKNVLTVRYQYEGGHTTNSGNGGNSLPSTFANTSNSEQEIQISDTQTFSPKVVNETRFEYNWSKSNSTALTAGAGLNVQGNFTAGGAGTQSSHAEGKHVEVQNYSSVALATNFMRFGLRLRVNNQANTVLTNANGSFTYNYLLDPCSDPTVSNKPSGCATVTSTPCQSANAAVSSYQCGIASLYRRTATLLPKVQFTETDLGLYAEDDWKIRPNLTFSYGMRYEFETKVSKHDISPRFSVAYGIPRSGGKTPITVVRGGFGLFYDRFQLGDFLTVQQLGANPAQQQLTLNNPNAVGCTYQNLAACSAAATAGGFKTVYSLAPNLRSPYTMQAAIGVDQQLGRIGTLSVNYLPSRGNHELLTRLNTDPLNHAYNYQFESTGVFKEQQVFVNSNIRMRNLTMFGFYALQFVNTNTSGSGFIPTSTDPKVDYGRAAFANRSFGVMGATWQAPYRFSVSPFLLARSGSPYNITTGTDVNGDSVYNDRPAFANGTTADCAIASTFSTPAAGSTYKEIPINYCTGPATATFNLRLSRTFGFGPKLEGAGGGAQGGGGGRRGGMAPGMAGGPPGGGHGGPGGPMGLGGNSGRRYNLTLGAQAQNLFNMVPYAAPTATSALTSTQFGRVTQLVGRPFSSPNAVRMIQLQATFNF